MRLQMFMLMGADDALETDILVKIKTADFYFHLIQKRCVYPPPPPHTQKMCASLCNACLDKDSYSC